MGVSTYYFNSNSEIDGDVELCYGFQCAYLTHAGSIAVGALMIPLMSVVRYTFYYVAKLLQLFGGEDVNPLRMCIAKLGDSCLTCFEDFIEQMDEVAFCYQAVAGCGFVAASKR